MLPVSIIRRGEFLMQFFRKLWQDLKNGEHHAGAVAWEVCSIAFILLVLAFGAGEKLIGYLLH